MYVPSSFLLFPSLLRPQLEIKGHGLHATAGRGFGQQTWVAKAAGASSARLRSGMSLLGFSSCAICASMVAHCWLPLYFSAKLDLVRASASGEVTSNIQVAGL